MYHVCITKRNVGITSHEQILQQVTPNPDEVKCKDALEHKNLNRNDHYLPGKVLFYYTYSESVHFVSLCSRSTQGLFAGSEARLH